MLIPEYTAVQSAFKKVAPEAAYSEFLNANITADVAHNALLKAIATALLAGALALLGIVTFPLLPVAPLPQVDFPTISVTAQLAGASPDNLEPVGSVPGGGFETTMAISPNEPYVAGRAGGDSAQEHRPSKGVKPAD